MSKIDEVEVYRAYVRAKADPKLKIKNVAKQFNLTRNGLYEVVRRIEGGNVAKIRRCISKAKFDCLWEHKYKAQYEAIPKNRKKESVILLKKLIKDMVDDDFTPNIISQKTGKDRATIVFHIEN